MVRNQHVVLSAMLTTTTKDKDDCLPPLQLCGAALLAYGQQRQCLGRQVTASNQIAEVLC